MPHDPSSAARPRRAAFFRCFLASLLLVLVAAGASVYLNAVDGQLLETALLENVDYAALGMDAASVSSFADETILFLTDAQDSWEPSITVAGFPASRFIPQDFREHMVTVKGWVSAASTLLMCGAAAAVLLLAWALATSGRRGGFSMQGYYAGTLLPLLFIAGVGLWASLDFGGMWEMLHRTLIPDGIFPADELVMRLFPETLFSAYRPPVMLMLVLMLAAVLVLPLILSPVSARIAQSRAQSAGGANR